jgi:hypothetical protein
MGRTGFVTLLAIVATAAVAFAVRPSAAISSGAGDPRIPALQKQVRTLQTQLKALQNRVADVDDQLGLNFEGDTCLAGQTADLVQGTWGVIDQIGQALQQKTYFGTQTPVDDFGNCEDLTKPDVPRPGIKVPPTIDPLRPLAQWLHE